MSSRDLDRLHRLAMEAMEDSSYDELHDASLEEVWAVRDRLEDAIVELVAEQGFRAEFEGVKVCQKCGKRAPARIPGMMTPYVCFGCSPRRREAKWRERGIKLTAEQYDAMNADQGGKCAMCRKADPTGMKLAVDHDHETGQVRALLCANCNSALWEWDHRIERLQQALDYLSRHGQQEAGATSPTA